MPTRPIGLKITDKAKNSLFASIWQRIDPSFDLSSVLSELPSRLSKPYHETEPEGWTAQLAAAT